MCKRRKWCQEHALKPCQCCFLNNLVYTQPQVSGDSGKKGTHASTRFHGRVQKRAPHSEGDPSPRHRAKHLIDITHSLLTVLPLEGTARTLSTSTSFVTSQLKATQLTRGTDELWIQVCPAPEHRLSLFLLLTDIQLTDNIVLVSGVQHRDSTILYISKMLTTKSRVTVCHHTEFLLYDWRVALHQYPRTSLNPSSCWKHPWEGRATRRCQLLPRLHLRRKNHVLIPQRGLDGSGPC